MFLENYCAQEFPSHEEMIELAAEKKNCFAEFVNFSPVTSEGEQVLAIVSLILQKNFPPNGRNPFNNHETIWFKNMK